MAKKPANLKMEGPDLKEFHKALKMLTQTEVLVGIPESGTDRGDGEPITNAGIGFLAEFGAPEINLPARPWLYPGIRENSDKISAKMLQVARIAVKGKLSTPLVDAAMHQVGIVAVSGIKKRIQEGLDPPLADSTLYARASRGDEGAAWELSWRMTGVDLLNGQLAKPYIDTGNFLRSINYAIKANKGST